MSESIGMLGCYFSQSVTDENHYLVASMWDTETNHEAYAAMRVPHLRMQAEVSLDLLEVTGKFVSLQETWRV